MNVISQMTTRRTRPMQRDLRVKILGPPHCGGAYIPEVGKGGCKRRESTTACCERKRVVAFPFLECGRLAAAFTVAGFSPNPTVMQVAPATLRPPQKVYPRRHALTSFSILSNIRLVSWGVQ